ncbi:MAG: PA2779 family protein, partial [Desulfobulbaceae bacterium]
AGLIGTETILNDRADHDPRARVAEFLAGEQVRKTMTGHGVSPEEVTARIAALSDAEIDRIAAELDSLPAGAGAGAVIGAVVLVFIVLLITDILGFTRVFPFTRPVR